MNKNKPKWTQEALLEALKAVDNGMPKRKAAEAYGIPWGTFINKVTGRRGINSAPERTFLTKTEEEEIVKFIKDSADRGFGKSKQELFTIIQQMLNFRNRNSKFPNNMPTEKWYRNFKMRYPQIVLRTAQKLGKQRAAVTKESLIKWFDQLTATVKDIDASIFLEPNRIFNCDESGFSLDSGTGKVLTFMGTKFVYQLGSEQKTMITALVCCNAIGDYVWPMLIYPGTQFRGFKPNEVFEECFITKSTNGWTNQTIFADWLEQVFLPQTAQLKKPILLLVDGHISHQSIQAATLCKENNIILYALPAHSSHIMQPLDVGIFKTMKAEWRKAVKKQNEAEIITKRTFANVFKEAYQATVQKSLAQQAFKISGLYPLDPTNINWQKVLPSMSMEVGNQTHTVPDGAATPQHQPAAGQDTPALLSLSDATITIMPSPQNPSSSTPAPHLRASLSDDHIPAPVPVPSSSSEAEPPCIAGTSTCPDASSDIASNLKKFAMICAQIGESELRLYYERLEEGYDCDDPLYRLWKLYHGNILLHHSKSSRQNPPPNVAKDPLSLPVLKQSSMRRRTQQKLPPLISGKEFIDHLINKDRAEKEEEERKAIRKIDLEKKKQEKLKAIEEKAKRKEEKIKLREEQKRQREEENQRRKEDRKRKLEEKRQLKDNSKGKGPKKRKTNKMDDSETDTSIDESQMIFDDESEDDFEDLDLDLD